MVDVQGVPVVFTGCMFANGDQAGLYITGTDIGRPTVMHCCFEKNRFGLRLANNARVKFQHVLASCFIDNTEYGFYAEPYTDGLGKISATDSWWGDISGPGGAAPGLGDAITDNILYDPWAIEHLCDPMTTGIEEKESVQTAFKVHAPYPNPFNPVTTIRFELPDPNRVKLEIYSITGQLVKTMVNEAMPEGIHEFIWNGSNKDGMQVKSGMYFYRINAGNYNHSGKLILLR
jgi:hypothetical protein